MRQGGLKKAFRGRLRLYAGLENPETPEPTLVLTVDCARDLEPLEPSAYVMCYLEDSASATKSEVNLTRVKEESKHPLWGEKFMWRIAKR